MKFYAEYEFGKPSVRLVTKRDPDCRQTFNQRTLQPIVINAASLTEARYSFRSNPDLSSFILR